MKKLFFMLTIMLLISCEAENMQRSPKPNFEFTSKNYSFDETSLEYQMEMALLNNDKDERYKKVEELLKMGANPNKMTGQFKWVDTNPLWEICGSERFVQLFVSYGADVKNRPYVAKATAGRIATTKEQYDEWKKEGYAAIKLEDTAFKAAKILLENGADPNLKWIGSEKVLFPATNWNYKRYFEKHGESPINHAIRYNSIKIVTLLLEYGVRLDEKSLQLAQETTEQAGASEMEDLIKEQWAKQK